MCTSIDGVLALRTASSVTPIDSYAAVTSNDGQAMRYVGSLKLSTGVVMKHPYSEDGVERQIDTGRGSPYQGSSQDSSFLFCPGGGGVSLKRYPVG